MPALCVYFKVHQPYRLKKYSVEEISTSHCYENAAADEASINEIADTCYLPANDIILSAIKKHDKNFKVSFSISGTTIELLQRYRPDVIVSFKSLVETGCVEILAETYFHSLSSLHSKDEFKRQVQKHTRAIKNIFGYNPRVFRNTELIYNNSIAKQVADLGYAGILCEGVERLLCGRNINKLYAVPGLENFGLLLRNASLSDDIAFRFDDINWSEHPLTAEKFAEWMHAHPLDTEAINLFFDYETFGAHKKKDSGIFDFLEALPAAVLANDAFYFSTPGAVMENNIPSDVYDVQQTISWSDREKQCCVWCENMMQNNTLKKIYSLEKIVNESGDLRMRDVWGRLQAADYFYYMADKHDAGKYINPFDSAEEVFGYYNNIVTDFEITLIQKELEKNKQQFYPHKGTLY